MLLLNSTYLESQQKMPFKLGWKKDVRPKSSGNLPVKPPSHADRPKTAPRPIDRSEHLKHYNEIIEVRSGGDVFSFPTPSPRVTPRSSCSPADATSKMAAVPTSTMRQPSPMKRQVDFTKPHPPLPTAATPQSTKLHRKKSGWSTLGSLFKHGPTKSTSSDALRYAQTTPSERPRTSKISHSPSRIRAKTPSPSSPKGREAPILSFVTARETQSPTSSDQDSEGIPEEPPVIPQLELPNHEFGRYSVLFGKVLESRPSLLERRQGRSTDSSILPPTNMLPIQIPAPGPPVTNRGRSIKRTTRRPSAEAEEPTQREVIPTEKGPDWELLNSRPLKSSQHKPLYPRINSAQDLERQIIQVSVARQASVSAARRQVQRASNCAEHKPTVVNMDRSFEAARAVLEEPCESQDS
ncbi:hypothetical protein K470DRAFT_73140 [Piedraia hortae CBS 480.64]|uniref:Uncharacterized protein n=1 Tax=Piedraia hortae CBS 480.64 TaxID=1314780 RepID=A0A6A7C030_9PEZI|nr:hypothetical protein K470DRAFT_73140 [Piedraia hortae CBS 480.64]